MEENYQEKILDLQLTNKDLREELKQVIRENEQLRETINKAIEYIKEDDEINKYSKDYLLEILKEKNN